MLRVARAAAMASIAVGLVGCGAVLGLPSTDPVLDEDPNLSSDGGTSSSSSSGSSGSVPDGGHRLDATPLDAGEDSALEAGCGLKLASKAVGPSCPPALNTCKKG